MLTEHLVWKDVQKAAFCSNKTVVIARDDSLAQIPEILRLVEDPSSGQVADVLRLFNVTELQCSELADYHMTQSLGAIVFVDDQGEIEETLIPDTLQVALEVQKLA